MPMDEKQKIMILVGLGVVFIGFGAYRMLTMNAGPGPVATVAPTDSPAADPADPTNPTPAATTANAKDAPKNPAVAFPLNRRDPFQIPQSVVSMVRINDVVKTTSTPSAPRPMPTSNIHPLPSMGSGSFPKTTVGSAPPKPVAPEPPAFAYSALGVVVGRVPAVVFVDSQGNQKLVSLNGSIDPDTTVEAISLNQVVVKYFGKTLRLPVGGKIIAQ